MELKNTEQVADFINQIENTYPVNEWLINGYHIWPLLRIEIGYYLNYKYIYRDSVKEYKPKSMFSSALSFLQKTFEGCYKYPYYTFWKNPSHNDQITRRDIMYITDGCGYIDIMGEYYERYYDSFDVFFKTNSITSLRLDMHHRYVPKRASISIFAQIKLELHMITQILFKPKVKIDFSNLPRFYDFLKFCKKEGLDSASLHLPNLEKRLIKLDAIKSFFEAIIETVKPKLVFITCFHNDYGLALINLCRSKGIKTLDVQHGFQESIHPAYGRWKNVPKEGYNVLPDYFWCWGPTEAQTIDDWSSSLHTHKPLAGGNLLLKLLSNESNAIVQKLDEQFNKVLKTSKYQHEDKINILFTLQWDTVGDEMLMPLYDTMKQSENRFNWWLRLHPVMFNQREMIRSLFIKNGVTNFELDFPSDLPLYTILRKTHVHITCSSAVVIEAREFNIPSIVINQYAEALFKDFIQKGVVKKAYNAKEILAAIDNFSTNNKHKTEEPKATNFDQIPQLLYLRQIIQEYKTSKNQNEQRKT